MKLIRAFDGSIRNNIAYIGDIVEQPRMASIWIVPAPDGETLPVLPSMMPAANMMVPQAWLALPAPCQCAVGWKLCGKAEASSEAL